jgi:hypothetical protein
LWINFRFIVFCVLVLVYLGNREKSVRFIEAQEEAAITASPVIGVSWKSPILLKAINEKVRLYAQVGQALIEAKDTGSDPFEAIERVVSWEQFTQSVQEAEKLARPEDFDYLGLLSNHYSQLRRYTPAFLEAFEFRATPAARKILDSGRGA